MASLEQKWFHATTERGVLLCIILEEEFQGLAGGFKHNQSQRYTAEISAEHLAHSADAVAINLQGSLPSARRIW